MFTFAAGPLLLNDAVLESQLQAASRDGRIQRAEAAAEKARADAPVVSGAYRDGIGVDVSGDEVTLVDDDPDAMFKEYGTVDTPAHSVLTNAAQSIAG